MPQMIEATKAEVEFLKQHKILLRISVDNYKSQAQHFKKRSFTNDETFAKFSEIKWAYFPDLMKWPLKTLKDLEYNEITDETINALTLFKNQISQAKNVSFFMTNCWIGFLSPMIRLLQ
ncbi:unnamed protein product [Blepharisma stoltei]|uniref:Uncharacterized protein n=1 Tax=Blepharisma stoltei TaxID=1481888 RepID=A0AAU9JRF3_9CILI|nr:unnamed protein product [Blepharisma stoltei]